MAIGVLYLVAVALIDDDVPYNEVLFLGTHNSAINLGASTVARPADAVGGAHPSEAHSAYQYIVMDQRLSILDQLEQGVRVLDFEMAALSSDWRCDDAGSSLSTCEEHVRLSGRCFSGCPFIVSHGTVKQSISLLQGYTFPEVLFTSVAEFVAAHPDEIVTLLLISSHGERASAYQSTFPSLTSHRSRQWLSQATRHLPRLTSPHA